MITSWSVEVGVRSLLARIVRLILRIHKRYCTRLAGSLQKLQGENLLQILDIVLESLYEICS